MHIFHSLTQPKQLLLVQLCDMTAGIGASFWLHRQKCTAMKVEIVTYLDVLN